MLYRCHYLNHLAFHITHSLVPPSAPTIGVVMATSSTSISVQWAASSNDGGSPITGYVVEYRNASDSVSQFVMRSVGSNILTTTVIGLAPFTTYDVRVRGENIVGRSDPSTTVQRRTDPDGELIKTCAIISSRDPPSALKMKHSNSLAKSHFRVHICGHLAIYILSLKFALELHGIEIFGEAVDNLVSFQGCSPCSGLEPRPSLEG